MQIDALHALTAAHVECCPMSCNVLNVLQAGQGDTLNGSICPADVAAICVAALQDPAADGVTFEVIDEWAKAPAETAASNQDSGAHCPTGFQFASKDW